ncbi:190aa long hypothetical protein [Pyrococcus horikoshii OT3]|uniref:Uncharacterized protein n=1 Tax=Pyrococcus horikoshii (strain ATCC 700860 / DSM 12428 / JCM 9974 / NBRC 100139 / OT-3) TaxID=70601 RepID=O59555_PYRHO|nr:190aa long hypothetical protein [Pyrococcus horikoshii OT3]
MLADTLSSSPYSSNFIDLTILNESLLSIPASPSNFSSKTLVASSINSYNASFCNSDVFRKTILEKLSFPRGALPNNAKKVSSSLGDPSNILTIFSAPTPIMIMGLPLEAPNRIIISFNCFPNTNISESKLILLTISPVSMNPPTLMTLALSIMLVSIPASFRLTLMRCKWSRTSITAKGMLLSARFLTKI